MDTNETQPNSEHKENDRHRVDTHITDVLGYVSAHIRPIGVILLGIIFLGWMSAPRTPKISHIGQQGSENAENLIQKSEEMMKSSKLMALPELQDDFSMATDLIGHLFSSYGFETSAYRLTDVYDYYVTPAQEANGLRDPKRIAVRFALRRKSDSTWKDLSDMKTKEGKSLCFNLAGRNEILVAEWRSKPGKFKQYENDILIDIATWNGERKAAITNESSKLLIEESLAIHKEKGFE